MLASNGLIVMMDEERAIEALPKLAATGGDRRLVLESLQRMRAIRQPKLTDEQQRRVARVEALLAVPAPRTPRTRPRRGTPSERGPVMTDLNLDDLTADKIHAYIKQEGEQKRAAEAAAQEHARQEREQLRKKFEAEEIPVDALQHVFGMVRSAVEQGQKEVMVLHFPSDFLPDNGRRISIGGEGWPEHLSGFAALAYSFCEKELRPRGFALSASIIDYPCGKPGDVGLFLRW
ncbi:MAG TPA: hypothetical protein VMA86_09040 [Acetobacteraceae bacterium]|nr:hypothetical protein [Acetobacteraceae bacterium]